MANSHRNGQPRVAIISDERYPHHATNTQQIIKNASALTEAGLSMDLVIPYQAKALFRNDYSTEQAIYKYYNVADSLRIKKIFSLPASELRIEKFTHCFAATFYASLKKYDIIYTRNELTAILCLLLGKKTIFETYRRLGHEYPKGMKFLLRWFLKPHFLGMVLHSNFAADSMLKVGIPKEKLVVLHNGFDSRDMEPVLSKEAARKSLGLEVNDLYAVYTGNMQKGKGMGSLVSIAALMPKGKIIFVGGTAEDLERLKQEAKEKGAENIIFTGRQPIAKVSEYLYASDVLLIPPVSGPLHKVGRTVLPFKIFPYLAAARPIFAPDLADMRELLVDNENAILVEPDNTATSAKALNELMNDEKLMNRLGKAAGESAKDLTWENRAKKFMKWLKTVA